jgi:thioredoxin-like negative regulator of GroEL
MFVKIDVDANPIVSAEFKVQSIPTFYFLNGKKVVSEVRELQLESSIIIFLFRIRLLNILFLTIVAIKKCV